MWLFYILIIRYFNFEYVYRLCIIISNIRKKYVNIENYCESSIKNGTIFSEMRCIYGIYKIDRDFDYCGRVYTKV